MPSVAKIRLSCIDGNKYHKVISIKLLNVIRLIKEKVTAELKLCGDPELRCLVYISLKVLSMTLS